MLPRPVVRIGLFALATGIGAATYLQAVGRRDREIHPTSAQAVPAAASIPQNAARMERRSRDRLEWNRKTLAVAYDEVGKKDPRWDAPAHLALELAALMFSQQGDPIITPAQVHAPAEKAVEAGCDDPLILYLFARNSVGTYREEPEEYARRIEAAASAMAASRYSPIRRASAIMAAAEIRAWKQDFTPEERRDVEGRLDADMDLLPESVARDPRNEDWEDRWYENINMVIALYRRLGLDYKAAFDRVDARLAKIPGIEALRLTVKGNFLMLWGWETRTTAFAPFVGAGRFGTFEAKQREARAALEAAWEANPNEPHVADLMLAVEKGVGGGDREAMELWFERAMTADGNDREACWSKLDWLDPKWHGDADGREMLAFGKACRATKNWRTGITLLAADAHYRYSTKIPREEQRPYLGSPAVWDEIREVYDDYLKRYPDDDVERSKYAALGYIAGHYTEAYAQFKILGDRLTTWPTFPNYTLPMLKGIRDEVIKWVEANRRDVVPGREGADSTRTTAGDAPR